MSAHRKVATSYKVDGREFVDVDDFLACYPNVSSEDKEKVKRLLSTCCCKVEKRKEYSLVDRLINICLDPKGWNGIAAEAPIVLCDGWVIWSRMGHDHLIDAFGRLFIERNEPKMSTSEMIKILAGEAQDTLSGLSSDLITSCYAWYISTQMPSIICVGREYKPSRADRKIFELFQVRYID